MRKLVILHDVEVQTPKGLIRWAYSNRSLALANAAPPDWEVTRLPIQGVLKDSGLLADSDVVFNIDYMMSAALKKEMHKRGLDMPLVSSFNRDHRTNNQYWLPCYGASDFVISNGPDRYHWAIHEGFDRVCGISNGVDYEYWSDGKCPIEERPIDVLWSGSSTPAKGQTLPRCHRAPDEAS